jgi:hypothetical protein
VIAYAEYGRVVILHLLNELFISYIMTFTRGTILKSPFLDFKRTTLRCDLSLGSRKPAQIGTWERIHDWICMQLSRVQQ